MSQEEYHGIIINRSQKDKQVFAKLKIIGQKRAFFGLVILYKIAVNKEELAGVIQGIQENMAAKLFFRKQEFYAHFYRNNELIIVFQKKIFNVTRDRLSWKEAVAYGQSLGIAERQLDFKPNSLEFETY